jgi:hypothetical protein
MDAELENDSQTYDAFTKGCEEGRIAGLKEALEISRLEEQTWVNHQGMQSPPLGVVVRLLRARISSLSPKESGK